MCVTVRTGTRRKLRQCNHPQRQALKNNERKRLRVRPYEGRNPISANGCTTQGRDTPSGCSVG